MTYEIALFIHLLGLALFLIAHGVSVFFSFALKSERNPERIRAILDLSLASLGVNYVGLLLLIGGGVWLGFMGQFWSQGWIWTSLALLVATMALMMFMGVTYFGKVRQAVGLQPYRRTGQVELGPVATADELDRLLSRPQRDATGLVGALALVVILALMVFKPF